MAENKTQAHDGDVKAFLEAVEHPTRCADGLALDALFRTLTGWTPRMWGPTTRVMPSAFSPVSNRIVFLPTLTTVGVKKNRAMLLGMKGSALVDGSARRAHGVTHSEACLCGH
jgi:hypothetical protein